MSNFTKKERDAMIKLSDDMVRRWMDACSNESSCNHEYTFNVNVHFLAAQAFTALVHNMGAAIGEEPVSLSELDVTTDEEMN